MDVWEQLFMAIEAVFRSWNNPRAILYRQLNNIPDDWGTAVNIVQMVFGNRAMIVVLVLPLPGTPPLAKRNFTVST